MTLNRTKLSAFFYFLHIAGCLLTQDPNQILQPTGSKRVQRLKKGASKRSDPVVMLVWLKGKREEQAAFFTVFRSALSCRDVLEQQAGVSGVLGLCVLIPNTTGAPFVY